MIDPTIIIFTGGVLCTALAAFGGYIQGRNVARMESDNFWAMQQKIKAKDAKAKFEKASKNAKKGWETRRRRAELTALISELECNH